MAIKAGAILTDVNGFVVDRIQSGGPGNLNIPEEKIYELGNWNTVATVRDIPDLSFDLESFDVFSEFEALLLAKGGAAAPGSAATGTQLSGQVGSNEIDFRNHVPIDVISPFKSRRNAYNIVKGVVVPYLTLENATYRFGIGQNATQSFSLRGDSIYYTPGQPYFNEVTSSTSGNWATSGGAVTNPFHAGGSLKQAVVYTEDAKSVFALCVTAITDKGDYKRLFFDDDYTNDATSLTITAAGAAKIGGLDYTTLGSTKLRITWNSLTTGNYNQTGNNPQGNAVHQGVSVKPAAVRPKDIDVYIGTAAATPTFTRFTSVQSAEVTWSVSLDPDQEFGNKNYVGMDYDIPDVTGSIGVRPYNPADMWDKLARITGVSSSEVVGPDSAVPLPLEIRINHPDTGNRVKTIYVPDARFQIPGFSGQVQQKLESTLPFTSDSGLMYVYNGARTSS
jgi:hypothetical protein